MSHNMENHATDLLLSCYSRINLTVMFKMCVNINLVMALVDEFSRIILPIASSLSHNFSGYIDPALILMLPQTTKISIILPDWKA